MGSSPTPGTLQHNDLRDHRDHGIRRALAPVHHLSAETGAAAVLVGHLNKAPGTDLFARVGGSIGLTGAARAVLLMTPDPEAGDDPDARVLTHGKSNLGPLAPALRLRVVGREIVADGTTIVTAGVELLEEAPHLRVADVLAPADTEGRTERDEARAFLLAALADDRRPAQEVQREARDAGISEKTLRRAKTDLGVRAERVGGIAGAGRWMWSLPKMAKGGWPSLSGGDVATLGNGAQPRDNPPEAARYDGHSLSVATLEGSAPAYDPPDHRCDTCGTDSIGPTATTCGACLRAAPNGVPALFSDIDAEAAT